MDFASKHFGIYARYMRPIVRVSSQKLASFEVHVPGVVVTVQVTAPNKEVQICFIYIFTSCSAEEPFSCHCSIRLVVYIIDYRMSTSVKVCTNRIEIDLSLRFIVARRRNPIDGKTKARKGSARLVIAGICHASSVEI